GAAPSSPAGAAVRTITGELNAVSAVSASDAWAVGATGRFGMVPLIVHWDGRNWSRVKGPGIPVSGKLLGVSMVSATDGWAVGVNPFKGNHILLHWNGTSWAPVPGPNGGQRAFVPASGDCPR